MKLFQRARQLPPGERAAFVFGATEDDELRQEVLALLDAHDDGAVNVESIVGEAAADLEQARIRSHNIGPYRLVELISEGGMGRVYLAERDDEQFQQKVAIKVLGTSLPSKLLVDRFRAERQMLANLNHPCVAKLLDGGETDDGLPYLVMEFVEGDALLDYCARQRLGLAERLELFIKVCGAIQHAHQNLIIHRDIKSNNIIVDPTGRPKLLDFGIAKLLQDDAGSLVTQDGGRFMTPANASPEQILGQPVTAATDVYALGLLLYEMLVGLPAYDVRDTKGAEFARLVCETMPSKPSVRATQSPNDRFSETIPDRVRRSLSGDLDTIIMKALRKEPQRRYATAAALADDVQRYLAHRPVAARPEGLLYVAGKFARRNRTLLGIATVFVALIGVAITQVIAERNRASAEAANAAAALAFMVDTFGSSDPNVTKGETVTAKAVLDRGAEQLTRNSKLSASTRALLGDTIGQVYKNLGLYEPAYEQLSAAAALHESLGQTSALVNTLRHVGAAQSEQGDFPAAKATLERALALAESIYPSDHTETATTMAWLAQELGNNSLHDESIALFERAIAMRERLGETSDTGYIESRYGLGEVLMITGSFEDSEANFRVALEAATDSVGLRNSLTIKIMQSLAVSLHEAGKLEEAEPYYLQADALEREVLGDDHSAREYTLTSIGRLYRHMGRYEEAERYLRAAVAAAKRSLGDRNVFTGYDMINLANFLASRGNYDEAEPLYVEALDIYAEALPKNHLYVASASIGFSKLLHVLDRPKEAQSYAEAAVAISEAILPDVHTVKGNAIFMLGLTLMGQGQLDQAEQHMLAGAEMIQAATPNDPVRPTVLQGLIELYTLRNDTEKVATYQSALDAVYADEDGA
ncbi:MAG: tetratricopeptide repeat protein [Pseudomonadota bacterium]